MVSDKQLQKNISYLEGILSRNSSSVDFTLNDGSSFNGGISAKELVESLKELLAWRTQVVDFEYDSNKKGIVFTGDVLGEDR